MYDNRIARRRFLQRSAAALAGIAAGAGFSLTDGTKATATNVKLTWLVRSGVGEENWEQTVAVPHFQRQNPGITINRIVVPDASSNFDIKLSNLLTAGTPADVWSQWGPSDFVDYSWRGLTRDIGPYLKRDIKEYADFYPGAMDYGKWNGHQVGVPLMLGGTYCFYNMDLFDKAGVPYPPVSWEDKSWNWNAMLAAAKKLTANYNDPGKAVYGVYGDLGCKEEFVWLWGGDVWDKEAYLTGVPHTSHWNTPEAIDAMQSLADLTYVHKVSPTPAVIGGLSGNNGNDPFLTGRVAMRLTLVLGFVDFKNVPFRWGVAALPGMHANKGGIYADPWLLSSRSKNPDAAWEFIKYLTTTQGAREYMLATNTPVPHKQLLAEWIKQFKTMKPEQIRTVFDGSLKHGQLSIQNDLVGYDRIRNIIEQEFSPMMLGTAKAKDIAPVVDQQLSRLFRRLHL